MRTKKQNNFISNFFVLLSSNVLQLLLGIVTSIIVARWLAPDGLGLKTVLANFPALFVTFFEMGTRQSTIFFIANHKYDERRLLPTVLALWLIFSLIGLLLYGVLSYYQFRDVSVLLIIVSASYIPIKIGHSFLSGILLGKQMIGKLAIFNVANAVFTPVLTILFLVVFDWGVFGVLFAAQLVALYTLLARVFLLKNELGLKLCLHLDVWIAKDIFIHGFYYAVALFLTTNFTVIPIFLMNNRISSFDIGIYSAGSAIALLLKQVVSSTFPLLFSKGANAIDKEGFSLKVHQLLRISMFVLFLAGIFIYYALEYILPLMFGDKYSASVPITRIMLLGVYAYILQYILISDMAGKGKPQVTIKATLPAFLLCVIFNYFSIGTYGNIGAAISTSLAMLICCVSYFIIYSKEIKIPVIEILRPRYSDWVSLKLHLKSLVRK